MIPKEFSVRHPIDFRSDTVTKPTEPMRQAMSKAHVGDDVMRTDPTVIALEERTASMFAKEAALFVPSGTMANLLAILAHTVPGDEIITHDQSHVYYYEVGGYASIAGCSVRFVDDTNAPKPGIITADALAKAVRPEDIHYPNPKLLTLENTHNRAGGVVWPVDTLTETCDKAKSLGLKVHTDGARIWNASIAQGVDLATLAKGSDTVSACLSKGLGCPVGSLLIGDKTTIETARAKRKMLGGGMRQAGIIAAAGLYALDNHLDRLAEDHANAKALADDLAQLSMFDFDPTTVETNLIYAKLAQSALDTGNAFAWQSKLEAVGILCYAESETTLRFVTHLDLSTDQLKEAPSRISSL